MKIVFKIEGGLSNPPYYEPTTDSIVVTNTIQRSYDYVFSHWGVGDDMIQLCGKIAMKIVSDKVDNHAEFMSIVLDSKAHKRDKEFKEKWPLKVGEYTLEDIKHMMSFPNSYNHPPFKSI